MQAKKHQEKQEYLENEKFHWQENQKLVEDLEEEQRQKGIKKLKDIKNYNNVWDQDIKIKEIQQEINKNIKNFSSKLIEEEVMRPLDTVSFEEDSEEDTEMTDAFAGPQFEEELMNRIEEQDKKGLDKQELKRKLVDLCALDPERRLDEVL